MRKNILISLLLIGLLTNGWLLQVLKMPFHDETLILIGILMIFMSAINERFVFIAAISSALLFGGFLTVYAFILEMPSNIQIQYMYTHLLFTSFLLMYWILLNLFKSVLYENSELKRQVLLLQKYNGVTQILNFPEFNEQSLWLLKSSERNSEEVWFLRIEISRKNKTIQKNLQETLEKMALKTIRQKYDLVSSKKESIFFLLKNTDSEGANRFLQRYWENCRSEINLTAPPYSVAVKLQVQNLAHLNELLSGERL